MRKNKKEKHTHSKMTFDKNNYIDDSDNMDYDYVDYDYDDGHIEYYGKYDISKYSYVYISDLNIFTKKITQVQYSGYGENLYETYNDENNIIHLEAYSFTCDKKIEAFFGCVLKTILRSKKISIKIKKIYNMLSEKYPEIYFKMIDKI